MDYQTKLDTSALEKSSSKLAFKFKVSSRENRVLPFVRGLPSLTESSASVFGQVPPVGNASQMVYHTGCHET